MSDLMKKALIEYGKTIQRDAWDAGEALIEIHEKRYPEFRKWAYALGVMLRTKEILAALV